METVSNRQQLNLKLELYKAFSNDPKIIFKKASKKSTLSVILIEVKKMTSKKGA
jgi:hypothetical protein